MKELANFNFGLLANIGFAEYTQRTIAMARVYQALDAPSMFAKAAWVVFSFTKPDSETLGADTNLPGRQKPGMAPHSAPPVLGDSMAPERVSGSAVEEAVIAGAGSTYRFQMYRHTGKFLDPGQIGTFIVTFPEMLTIYASPGHVFVKTRPGTGNMCSTEYDVAIIGGGPAGTAAAILAGQAGLRTLIVERTVAPRPRPGEALHPGVESLFLQLGIQPEIARANFLRYPGVRVCAGTEGNFLPFGEDASGPWLGYQARRDKLDAILLSHAQDLGAELCRPAVAADLTRKGDGWVVTTTRGRVFSRTVVDASGGGHWLARRAGLAISRLSPRLIVRFGYYPSDTSDSPTPAFRDHGGWWSWTAPVATGVRQWMGLSLEGRITSTFPPTSGAEPQKLGAADVTWRVVQACAGPGYFVAGDAAAVLDPAASHGVLRALMSGMLAAHLATAIAKQGLSPDVAARHYRAWLLSWFCRDVAELSSRYAQLLKPPSWLERAAAACALMPSETVVRQQTTPSFTAR